MMAAMALRATPSTPNILATEGNSIPTSSSSSFLSCHNSDLVSQTTGSIAGSSSNRWNISHGLVGLFGQQDDTLNTASSVTTDMAVIAPASDLPLPPLHPVHQISTNLHAHQSQTSLQASNGTNVSQLPEHKSAGEQPKVYCHSGSTTLHGNYSDDCFQCMWSDSQQICHARMGTYNIFIKHLHLHIFKTIKKKAKDNNCSYKCQWFTCQAWEFNTPSALINHVRQNHLGIVARAPKFLLCQLPLSQPLPCPPICQSLDIPQYFLTAHPVQKSPFSTVYKNTQEIPILPDWDDTAPFLPVHNEPQPGYFLGFSGSIFPMSKLMGGQDWHERDSNGHLITCKTSPGDPLIQVKKKIKGKLNKPKLTVSADIVAAYNKAARRRREKKTGMF
ncbi:hypothetical protein CNBJ0670 [Cryptococcus deneoformans B-3501A]|uniref:Expressed protein n=1 Tax=Cryptococcus deneoformans (strain JEC21 / ATCC MYA-565) TaxID=214684 RepID=Q5KA69_CRYD1|nr:expressed protein [Cryptococcus neoformans var. neoformans JEC21]XP_773072.1 hypothetical protein CNBJ0670 [Cryptococcus neoformans var. neoformans B-3501A]AAW45922.1 expressed protein [Cryptococcus neoformans var. neoformans JEC21]EAL18425.1 hypothetical protein CNBJ0670 [Cryptococcus neoformans var. neoformans B-3501A]